MCTHALALNVEALKCIVEVYGPKPVHIEPLQLQARGCIELNPLGPD